MYSKCFTLPVYFMYQRAMLPIYTHQGLESIILASICGKRVLNSLNIQSDSPWGNPNSTSLKNAHHLNETRCGYFYFDRLIKEVDHMNILLVYNLIYKKHYWYYMRITYLLHTFNAIIILFRYNILLIVASCIFSTKSDDCKIYFPGWSKDPPQYLFHIIIVHVFIHYCIFLNIDALFCGAYLMQMHTNSIDHKRLIR